MTGSEESGDGYGKGSHESIVDHGGRNICGAPTSGLCPSKKVDICYKNRGGKKYRARNSEYKNKPFPR